jgi:hypothetical protein
LCCHVALHTFDPRGMIIPERHQTVLQVVSALA